MHVELLHNWIPSQCQPCQIFQTTSFQVPKWLIWSCNMTWTDLRFHMQLAGQGWYSGRRGSTKTAADNASDLWSWCGSAQWRLSLCTRCLLERWKTLLENAWNMDAEFYHNSLSSIESSQNRWHGCYGFTLILWWGEHMKRYWSICGMMLNPGQVKANDHPKLSLSKDSWPSSHQPK